MYTALALFLLCRISGAGQKLILGTKARRCGLFFAVAEQKFGIGFVGGIDMFDQPLLEEAQ